MWITWPIILKDIVLASALVFGLSGAAIGRPFSEPFIQVLFAIINTLSKLDEFRSEACPRKSPVLKGFLGYASYGRYFTFVE